MWWRGGEENFELVVFSSYQIEEGKIVAQTIHYTVEKKVGCGPHTLRCRSEQQAYQALYRGERATQQECDPDEAFAAILSEPDLTNPQHDRPEAEHQAPHAPRPEDQRKDRSPYEQDSGQQPQHPCTWRVSRSHKPLSMMPPILGGSELRVIMYYSGNRAAENPLGLRPAGPWHFLHVSQRHATGHYPSASPIAPAA